MGLSVTGSNSAWAGWCSPMALRCVSFHRTPQGCRIDVSATGTGGAHIQEGLGRFKPFWGDTIAGLPTPVPAPAVPWNKVSSEHSTLCQSQSSG